MWQQYKYVDQLDDGARYTVELTTRGMWVAHFVQYRNSLPIKQVDAHGKKHDFATAFDAIVACDLHRRELSIDDALAVAS